ncbi:MAG: LemA family protein [Eubacteriales bacterium]|nr:LemA family protein [Eubacteriales bacterium]
MTIIIIAAAVLLLSVLYIAKIRQQLTIMNENINNAMSQIGVQLSSRYDVVTALAELVGEYDAGESRAMLEAIRSSRNTVDAQSLPSEVTRQEKIMEELLCRIAAAAERYPQLKNDPRYLRYLNAAERYENMICTGCMIYNDSVSKLNRIIHRLPVRQTEKVLGISRREYIEMADEK